MVSQVVHTYVQVVGQMLGLETVVDFRLKLPDSHHKTDESIIYICNDFNSANFQDFLRGSLIS